MYCPKTMAKKKAAEQKPEPAKQNPQIPPEMQEKITALKGKLDTFQKEILKKFDKYIMFVSLLPPPKPQSVPPGIPESQVPKIDQDAVHTLVVIDDSDSKSMTKFELHKKLSTIIHETAASIDKKILPDVVLLSEVWQNCYDGKYELLQMVAASAPLYDRGMLQAIKIAEIHKSMVLKKFEKYIVSYVLAGSLVQGRSTKTSDIDVWIVIDDTDVKKMTRYELKEKLRAIIIGMGIEAGEITGIKNKLNIQVYILTDFWDSLKEANPIIFTLLRDGVPFYDRGVFMPWKLLLKMGKIKPSQEAIDMFMSSGEQMLDRVKFKLKDIGMEDTYYAILTPSQAALMLFGIPPPTPRETPELMREVFVKKEKMLEGEYVDILEQNISIRKDIEHGTKKELTGKDIDKLLNDSKKYLKRIKKLFTQIENIKGEEDIVHVYDSTITITRDVLASEHVMGVAEDKLVSVFKKELVGKGKVAPKFTRMLQNIVKAKKEYDKRTLSKNEREKAKKDAREYTKHMVELIQQKRGNELHKSKIKVKYGDTYGEVMILGKQVFITKDTAAENKEISTAKLQGNGRLGDIKKSSLEQMEKKIVETSDIAPPSIKEHFFEDLKVIFGEDVEIVLHA